MMRGWSSYIEYYKISIGAHVTSLNLFHYLTIISLSTCLCVSTVSASEEQDLAAASQNPVADMISLPLKNKFDFDRGSEDAFGYTLRNAAGYSGPFR